MTPADHTRLVLVRHGAVATDGTAYGQRADPPLSVAGHTEVAALRTRLPQAATVVVSPALRAAQTAAGLGLTPDRVDPRFAERDLGAWEGRPWSQVWSEVPAAVRSDASAYAAFTPPQGESVAALRARVVAALDDLGRSHRDEPADPVVVVCHAGPVVAAIAHALDLDDATALRLRIPTASATWLTRWDTGDWTVERMGA